MENLQREYVMHRFTFCYHPQEIFKEEDYISFDKKIDGKGAQDLNKTPEPFEDARKVVEAFTNELSRAKTTSDQKGHNHSFGGSSENSNFYKSKYFRIYFCQKKK